MDDTIKKNIQVMILSPNTGECRSIIWPKTVKEAINVFEDAYFGLLEIDLDSKIELVVHKKYGRTHGVLGKHNCDSMKKVIKKLYELEEKTDRLVEECSNRYIVKGHPRCSMDNDRLYCNKCSWNYGREENTDVKQRI